MRTLKEIGRDNKQWADDLEKLQSLSDVISSERHMPKRLAPIAKHARIASFIHAHIGANMFFFPKR